MSSSFQLNLRVEWVKLLVTTFQGPTQNALEYARIRLRALELCPFPLGVPDRVTYLCEGPRNQEVLAACLINPPSSLALVLSKLMVRTP